MNMTFNFSASPDVVPPAGPRVDGAPALAAQGMEKPRLRALLVGHPNVGKSVVFGALTGTYVAVSNYPGTTVEITRGSARFGDKAWQIVDTPGTHNLVPMSDDEAVTRDMLVSEPYDALVQVGDAKNLARTLLFTLQLAELGVPFCLDLNMADEARARGITVDLAALEAELDGVRVRTSTATEGEGLESLRDYLASSVPIGESDTAGQPLPRKPLAFAPRFPDDRRGRHRRRRRPPPEGLPVAKRAIATMLLGGERGVVGGLAAKAGPEATRIAREHAQSLGRANGVPVFALMSRLRLARARAIANAVQTRGARSGARAHAGHVAWGKATAMAGSAAAAGGPRVRRRGRPDSDGRDGRSARRLRRHRRRVAGVLGRHRSWLDGSGAPAARAGSRSGRAGGAAARAGSRGRLEARGGVRRRVDGLLGGIDRRAARAARVLRRARPHRSSARPW